MKMLKRIVDRFKALCVYFGAVIVGLLVVVLMLVGFVIALGLIFPVVGQIGILPVILIIWAIARWINPKVKPLIREISHACH